MKRKPKKPEFKMPKVLVAKDIPRHLTEAQAKRIVDRALKDVKKVLKEEIQDCFLHDMHLEVETMAIQYHMPKMIKQRDGEWRDTIDYYCKETKAAMLEYIKIRDKAWASQKRYEQALKDWEAK